MRLVTPWEPGVCAQGRATAAASARIVRAAGRRLRGRPRKAVVRLEVRVLFAEALGGELLLVGGAPRVPIKIPPEGMVICGAYG